MKIVYTESGRQALEEFKEEKVRELEKEISPRKYVYGDETIEITANDVREGSDRIRLPYRFTSARPMTQLLLQIYILFGVLATFAGLFYRNLKYIASEDPTQIILVLSGVGISFMSYLMLQRLRDRERERERIELIEREKKNLPSKR
jgi:hypothetical protein